MGIKGKVMEAFLGKGNLTEEEYKELITLEYVLTHRYTDDCKKDTERYMYLQEKKYAERNNFKNFIIILLIIFLWLMYAAQFVQWY